MAKRAIISDVHSNLEALNAVLADISDRGVTQIFNLGDIVGYGPNPRECIDLIMKCDVCILGNHDQGALFDPEGFNPSAEQAIFWTRQQLETSDEGAEARWQFLCGLERMYHEGRTTYVHGSLRHPLNEYVFPEDIHNANKIERIFSLVDHHCYHGHTHIPGVITEGRRYLNPPDFDYKFRIGEERVMINIGSVGQPRNRDWRADYVIIDDDVVEFRQVEYPVETTIEKIHSFEELDHYQGDRLREGK